MLAVCGLVGVGVQGVHTWLGVAGSFFEWSHRSCGSVSGAEGLGQTGTVQKFRLQGSRALGMNLQRIKVLLMFSCGWLSKLGSLFGYPKQ